MGRTKGERSLPARRAQVLVGIAGALIVTVVPGAGVEASSTDQPFRAVAVGEGMRVSVAVPKFVAVEQVVDGGGPLAQAVVDGLGTSSGFASLPYPGDNGVSGPSTVAGLLGLPSPPAYPFYAASSYPVAPEAKVALPGVSLESRSGNESSSAVARAGGDAGDSAVVSSTARATAAREPSGVVVAEAVSTLDGVVIGGVLRLGSVFARAKAVRPTSGELIRESEFRIDGVTVAGQVVGFTDQGFVVAGTDVALPDDSPPAETLRQNGIRIEYLAPSATPDGVASAAIVVTQQHQLPNAPTIITTYTIGRASAASTGGAGATLGALPPAQLPPSPGDLSVDPTGEGGSAGEPAGSPAEPPVSLTDGLGATRGAEPQVGAESSAADVSSPPTGGPAADRFGSAAPTPLSQVARPRALRSSSMAGLYLLVALGAIVVVTLSRVCQPRAVR